MFTLPFNPSLPSRPFYGNASVGIDRGAFYAAKDLLDPPRPGRPFHRRIYWGWTAYVDPAQGTMSLPRELTWDPELEQLVCELVSDTDRF